MILQKVSLPIQSYLQMCVFSLFSVHEVQASADDLNKDLDIVSNWAFYWKMDFNLEPTKHAQNVIFSRKAKEISHPPKVLM